jgi:hypothetical protein
MPDAEQPSTATSIWSGHTRVVSVTGGTPYTVYIGRANGRYRLRQSKWHNPFRIGQDGTGRHWRALALAYAAGESGMGGEYGEYGGLAVGVQIFQPGWS